MIFWPRKQPPATQSAPRRSIWGRKAGAVTPEPRRPGLMETALAATQAAMPTGMQGAMDSCSGDRPDFKYALENRLGGHGEGVLGFFAGHAIPMPYSICAHLSAHWLIDKACRIPARDAVRQGWILDVDDDQLLERIQRTDKAMRTARHLEQFVHLGRVFGVRVLLFRVESTVADYYEHPFNPDGVTPGSYKGMVQVDPQWCVPILDNAQIEPSRPGFYEPEFWQIGDLKVHKSHLVIFRNGELPDVLKPAYRYGGVSVPQRIVERVYAAERTANEAPELAMTKRTTVVGMDLAEGEMAWSKVHANLAEWVATRNNYGVKLKGHDDTVEQFDTTLADFDAVVMTSYQLVAAAANMPATKLLGTTPKGFNATGEYEEANYHEELESIQTHDLAPALDRHYLLLMRSWGLDRHVDYTWQALDTPTAAEYAELELKAAQRDQALLMTGAIDAKDIRDRLRRDRDGAYFGLEEVDFPDEEGGLGGEFPEDPETEPDVLENPRRPEGGLADS